MSFVIGVGIPGGNARRSYNVDSRELREKMGHERERIRGWTRETRYVYEE